MPGIANPRSWDELKQLGRQAEAFHDLKSAESFYKEALIQAEKAKMFSQVAETAARLVELYLAQRREAEAEPLYKRALAIAAEQKRRGVDNQDVLVYMNDLAATYEEKAETSQEQFEKHMLRALEIRRMIFGVRHPLVGRALEKLASYYAIHNRAAEAEKIMKELICYCQEREGRMNGHQAGIYMTLLAHLYLKEKKYVQARALATQALEIFKIGDARANVINLVAETYSKEGKLGEAERMYKTALNMHQTLYGARSPKLELDLIGLATVYKKRRQLSEARKIEARIISIHGTQTRVVRH